ncbi:unnamed protein product [Caenorhabditis sp. 36 PRJEB53466]|nr:unnamed protein product [Caenorhabditis sp. 36 PRJEB53466]
MTSFRERLTMRNATNVCIRIPLATFLIHQFSHWLFSRSRVEQLVLIFTAYPQFQYPYRAAKDLATLQKLTRFWPPHQGSGLGEFSIAFTVSLILFIRLIDVPTVLQSVFGYRYDSKILNFVLTPIYASVIPFLLLLPMMRLAEMHIFVLLLNFFHILVSSYFVFTVWFFLKSRSENSKEKTE